MKKRLYLLRLNHEIKKSGMPKLLFATSVSNHSEEVDYYYRNFPHILAGEIVPNEKTLQKLATALCVRYEYLIGESSFRTESDMLDCEKKNEERPKTEIIAERIRNLKYEYELSNPQLAAAAGCSEKHIPRLLKGQIMPHDDILQSLAAYFGVRYEYLAGNSPFPTEADIEEYNRCDIPDLYRFDVTTAYLKYLGFEFRRKDRYGFDIYFHGKHVVDLCGDTYYGVQDLSFAFNKLDDILSFTFLTILKYIHSQADDRATYENILNIYKSKSPDEDKLTDALAGDNYSKTHPFPSSNKTHPFPSFESMLNDIDE